MADDGLRPGRVREVDAGRPVDRRSLSVTDTVAATRTFSRNATAVESYRGRKIAQHFSEVYRIEVAVEDTAADAVIAGVAFARGTGLLGDAQAWISAAATNCSPMPHRW